MPCSLSAPAEVTATDPAVTGMPGRPWRLTHDRSSSASSSATMAPSSPRRAAARRSGDRGLVRLRHLQVDIRRRDDHVDVAQQLDRLDVYRHRKPGGPAAAFHPDLARQLRLHGIAARAARGRLAQLQDLLGYLLDDDSLMVLAEPLLADAVLLRGAASAVLGRPVPAAAVEAEGVFRGGTQLAAPEVSHGRAQQCLDGTRPPAFCAFRGNGGRE